LDASNSRGCGQASNDNVVVAAESVGVGISVVIVVVIRGCEGEQRSDFRGQEGERREPHDDEEDIQRQDRPVVVEADGAVFGHEVIYRGDERKDGLTQVSGGLLTEREPLCSTYHDNNKDIPVKSKPRKTISTEAQNNNREDQLQDANSDEALGVKGNMFTARKPDGRVLACICFHLVVWW